MPSPKRLFALLAWSACMLAAQNANLRGVVTDESGAVVPGATVLLTGKSNDARAAQTGSAQPWRVLDGFSLFRDPLKLVQVLALSFGMFLSYALALGITGWSMHIDLPWYAGLVILVVTAIGIMVPAAPGYVGTLNIACVVGLALFGIDKGPASAYSWFYFLSQWLPITSVGLYFLHREGLSLKSLGQAHGETP